jgi:hypothetical protein
MAGQQHPAGPAAMQTRQGVTAAPITCAEENRHTTIRAMTSRVGSAWSVRRYRCRLDICPPRLHAAGADSSPASRWRYLVTARERIAAALFLVFTTVVAGCQTDSPEPRQSPSLPVTLPASSPAAPNAGDAPQAAVAAYRGMWAAYMGVLGAPDPDSPELARYAAGDALSTLVDGVREVRNNGLKGEGEFSLAPRVTEVAPATSPTKVGIRDCLDDSQAQIVRASPGPAYNDKPGGRRLCLATVERQSDGAWKVTSFGLHEVGSCT